MNQKESYTKFFLSELGKDDTNENIKKYLSAWWFNTRDKESGGLRLTDRGLDVIKKLDIQTYEISFPKDMSLTPQIMLYLDHFIDCPYFITKKAIQVTGERKVVELTLFSGDIRKYGFAKAKTRQKKKDAARDARST